MASLMAGFILAGTFSLAHAGINARERRQQARIWQGAQSGELTRREFMGLERMESRIEADEARARADGRFTLQERARINHELNAASRRIYRQKHDAQDRR